ncbi:hypothetical protein [Longispora albida]|uniref:hypothetical protein n=1 Tax=Longispora albida TaxID=203523 RepID=UPI00036C1508|nr:hypothetical protein [Longispora albida]
MGDFDLLTHAVPLVIGLLMLGGAIWAAATIHINGKNSVFALLGTLSLMCSALIWAFGYDLMHELLGHSDGLEPRDAMAVLLGLSVVAGLLFLLLGALLPRTAKPARVLQPPPPPPPGMYPPPPPPPQQQQPYAG